MIIDGYVAEQIKQSQVSNQKLTYYVTNGDELTTYLFDIKEHDKQIREDSIDEFARVLIDGFCQSLSKYSSDEIISQIIKNCAEHLKEKMNE